MRIFSCGNGKQSIGGKWNKIAQNDPGLPPPLDPGLQPEIPTTSLLDQFNQRLAGSGMHIAENEYEPGYVVNIPETTIQLTEEEINLLNTMMEQLKMEVQQPEQQQNMPGPGPDPDPDQGFGFAEGLNDGMG